MKKALIAISVVSLAAFSLDAEQYKLKFAATVDVIEDGKVVGQKRLKSGTLLELADPAAAEAKSDADEPKAEKGSTSKLRVSKLSPMMFKTTRPSVAHTFLADVELSNTYWGPLEGKEGLYWSVDIYARNADGSLGTSFIGYAKKTSSIGREVKKITEDGSRHRCHIKIVPIKNPDYDNLVTIEAIELVNDVD